MSLNIIRNLQEHFLTIFQKKGGQSHNQYFTGQK